MSSTSWTPLGPWVRSVLLVAAILVIVVTLALALFTASGPVVISGPSGPQAIVVHLDSPGSAGPCEGATAMAFVSFAGDAVTLAPNTTARLSACVVYPGGQVEDNFFDIALGSCVVAEHVLPGRAPATPISICYLNSTTVQLVNLSEVTNVG